MKRRKFIQYTSCAAMGTTSLLSGLINMKALGAAALSNSSNEGSDYKALVCVMLDGGNDAFNMLVPTESSMYAEYAKSRSNNALPIGQLHALQSLGGSSGQTFGMHPSMPRLTSLYNSGQAAFIANIGTLVEPTARDAVYTNTSRLPLGLYSHSDQAKQWQTALPQDRASVGWGGKMAELIKDMNSNDKLSVNVSLGGNNFFQTGITTGAYSMSPGEGPAGLLEQGEEWRQIRDRAVKSMVDRRYVDLYEQTYINTVKNSLDSYETYRDAIAKTRGDLRSVRFGSDDWQFSQSMMTVAETIAAKDELDMQRQTFFVRFGDWDHHDELLNRHSTQLSALDDGIHSFQRAMEKLGLTDYVTTFVMSDFARPLVSNGNGTDHAWGGNVFVVGGSVRGQRIYGRYPHLSFNDDRDVGGGVFVPDTSCDEYFAELAMWFGVTPSDLPSIFPNISNFYDVQSGGKPIGFMK